MMKGKNAIGIVEFPSLKINRIFFLKELKTNKIKIVAGKVKTNGLKALNEKFDSKIRSKKNINREGAKVEEPISTVAGVASKTKRKKENSFFLFFIFLTRKK
ncbi:MAG: hypothetical protein Ct9H90mP4_09150 [Gammaproteobacteria bacterium]|nr:MAG: hypothetical protein Ct9H90mP4_09150 [Gammaproteobacteria bacterium]